MDASPVSDAFRALTKWVPYGVPKIGDRFDKSVFFLYRTNPKSGGVEGPLGTAFFTYRQGWREEVSSRGVIHYYGITNHHVAITQGATIIRVNTKDGKTRDLPFEVEDWHSVRNGDDVCAVDIDESTFEPNDSWSCIPEWTWLGKSEIAKREIGLGENAFMVGLFAPHHGGGKRNVMSGRFGNISMLADDDTPIRTDAGFNRPAHVVDMHSRSGFSGSPVFVYRTPYDDLQANAIKATGDRGGVIMIGGPENMFWGFIGIHSGQFQERVRVRNSPRTKSEGVKDEVEAPKILETSGAIRDGDYLVMPSSMTVVIPSWRITELLDLKVFKAIREKRDAAFREKLANGSMASDAGGVPASEADLNDRADFMQSLPHGERPKPSK